MRPTGEGQTRKYAENAARASGDGNGDVRGLPSALLSNSLSSGLRY